MRKAPSQQALFRRACAAGYLEEAKALRFEPRVRVNADDNVALREACAGGHTAVVEWLLQLDGVRVSSANFQALSIAASSGNLPLLRLLWTQGVEPLPVSSRLSFDFLHLMKILLNTALSNHQFGVARLLLTGKGEEDSDFVQLPPANSPEWAMALADPSLRHFWSEMQAQPVLQVLDRKYYLLCSSDNPAMNVVLAESQRQKAFLYAASRHDGTALEFLCSVSQYPLIYNMLVEATRRVSTYPADSEASRTFVQDLIAEQLRKTPS